MSSTGELQSSPWSSLPADLAGLIFCQLPLSHADRVSFMSVCRQWRLAAKPHLDQLPATLSWLCSEYPTYHTFRSLPDGEVRRLNKLPDTCTPSSASDSTFFNGWLLYEYERGDRSGTCFLANPFTVWEEDDDDEEPNDGDDDDSAPDSEEEEEEELPSELHYLVKSCDNDKLLMVRVRWSVPPGRRRCMERSDNVADGIKLRVFEADLEMAEWIEVEDDGLDGQALFVSEGCSRAIRLPSDHADQRFQGGRVYFPGDDLTRYFDEIHSGSIPSYGFYDLKEGTISLTYLDGPVRQIAGR
ncbi:hypothetical protein QOZ80_9BG0698860 [Eleusine coracana subsp. coracana]|nr:hypothetical protein QOZ80_9BG0698860 [Eleusine coracana subsp. coracana]